MRYAGILIIFHLVLSAHAQLNMLSRKLVNSSFAPEKTAYSPKKASLPVLQRTPRHNPLAHVGIGFLFIYQHVFSEQFQASCIYEVSCSEYTKLCIRRSGLIGGMLKGFNQLTECMNGALYEHPPRYISPDKKIKNGFESD
jgi:putative component of membrane protein insertase Oxa1/YidC/SpoIIIJ protein YidD